MTRKRGSHGGQGGRDSGDISWVNIVLRNWRRVVSVGIVLTIAIFGVSIYKSDLFGKGNRTKFLINADHEQLKESFFSDSPHLFYCHEHGNQNYIPKKLVRAHDILGDEYYLAALNCSQVLPSGKQIFERFKLNKDWSPIIFGTAPWSGRVQVPPSKLSKDSLHIANFISTALSPKEKRIESDKEFQEACGIATASDLKHETLSCLLILKGPLFSETQLNTVKTLVKSFHKSTFPVVSVESKTRWLSVESSSVLNSKFSMRLYAIRNGSHYMSLPSSSSSESSMQFVRTAMIAPISDFTDSPNIKLVKPPVNLASSQKRNRRAAKENAKNNNSPKIEDSTVEEGDPAEEQRRKEQFRREQMDKQNEDFIVEFDVNEEGTEEICLDGDCAQEEDIIEL